MQEIADACGLTKAGPLPPHRRPRSAAPRDHELRDGPVRGAGPRARSSTSRIRSSGCARRMARNIELVTHGLEQGSHDHPARAPDADRRGAARTSTRARSATCGSSRTSFARGGGSAARSARSIRRSRRSRSSAWCCGCTSGSSRAGSAPTTRSPRAWWIALHRPRAPLLTPFTKSHARPWIPPARGLAGPYRSLAPGGRPGSLPQLEGRITRMKTPVGIEALAVARAPPLRATSRTRAGARRRPGEVHRGPRRARDGGRRARARTPSRSPPTPRARLIDARRRSRAARHAGRGHRDRRGPLQAGRLVRAGPARAAAHDARLRHAARLLRRHRGADGGASSGSRRARPAGRSALVICSDIARYGVKHRGRAHAGRGRGGDAGLGATRSCSRSTSGSTARRARTCYDFWRPLGRREAQVDGHYCISATWRRSRARTAAGASAR